jgi:CRISPR/Cas system CSM-associated protein Csm3 (group 7 of RAMP superfamily)
MTNEWRNPRPIVRRIIVQGDLELQTPAHFGGGDAQPFSYTDMLLLRDPQDGQPLLPGASIAGALRNYLRERERGYHQAELPSKKGQPTSLTGWLFGGSKGDDEGLQSPLIVYDALARKESVAVELRDGVKIDPKTRTAEEGKKYNLETLAAGTKFPLRFELVIAADALTKPLEALALALTGLQEGAIHLGMRKRRGLGQAKVAQWQVWNFDLTTPEGLLGWLAFEAPDVASGTSSQPVTDIWSLLGVSPDTAPDNREEFHLKAEFNLPGALLIRSGFGLGRNEPDVVHLQLRQANGEKSQPVVPGTSFAGVIRHRALRIAKTLLDDTKANALVDGMFGCAKEGQSGKKDKESYQASRVRVADTTIERTNSEPIKSYVQTRVQIDRFTGGAAETKLFSEQPIFGTPDAALTLDLTLLNPKPAEIGLLLQVLKDLWLGDLPLGGASSVGRGRVQGRWADLTRRLSGQKTAEGAGGAPPSSPDPTTPNQGLMVEQRWCIEQKFDEKQQPAGLKIESQGQDLQEFVDALKIWSGKEEADGAKN